MYCRVLSVAALLAVSAAPARAQQTVKLQFNDGQVTLSAQNLILPRSAPEAVQRTVIVNVREGLDALEIYFRSTPGLQSYYLKLAGSASGAADAEAQAAMGQFDRSGRTLLGVVNRLTDVLLIMR